MMDKKNRHPKAAAKTVDLQLKYPVLLKVSRLEDLVTSLFVLAQRPTLDANDHAVAWSWFGKTLGQLVEVKHGL